MNKNKKNDKTVSDDIIAHDNDINDLNREIPVESEEISKEEVGESEEKKQIISLQEELEKTRISLKGALSDYQNFKRRKEEEQKELSMIATGFTLRNVLDVTDDFELVLKNIPEEHHKEQWYEGLKMVFDKMKEVISSQGVEKIDIKEGDKYDSTKQEAIGTVVGENINSISQIIRSGYMMNGRIIRPARVIVVKKN